MHMVSTEKLQQKQWIIWVLCQQKTLQLQTRNNATQHLTPTENVPVVHIFS